MNEQLRKITEWRLDIDDSFKFGCKQCGRCCVNNTIIVNTYDVIRMRHTLKMTTEDMIANDLLSFNVGPNSGMSIATIRFRRINDDVSAIAFTVLYNFDSIMGVFAQTHEKVYFKNYIIKAYTIAG